MPDKRHVLNKSPQDVWLSQKYPGIMALGYLHFLITEIEYQYYAAIMDDPNLNLKRR